MVESQVDSTDRFERLLAGTGRDTFELELFVTGMTERSVDAVRTVKGFCDEYLPGRYRLQIIDLHDHPDRVKDAQIVAVPTLVRKVPLPISRLIGDLSNKNRILEWFRLWIDERSESRCNDAS